MDHEDGQEKTQNMNAVIDDGTGRIKVMAWSVSPAWQSAFKRGQFVQIIGPIREYDDFITKTRTKTILIEIIREETNPNCELYHDLKMIQNRLKKPQVEVQKQSKGVSINTSHSEEGTEFEETLDFEEDEDSLETINQMAESEAQDQIVPFFEVRKPN